MSNKDKCFQCGNKGLEMFGYIVCNQCKSNIGLFTDETIKKHIALYGKTPGKRSYKEEIDFRLDYIEKEYIKKRIKLLYIKERLNEM